MLAPESPHPLEKDIGIFISYKRSQPGRLHGCVTRLMPSNVVPPPPKSMDVIARLDRLTLRSQRSLVVLPLFFGLLAHPFASNAFGVFLFSAGIRQLQEILP